MPSTTEITVSQLSRRIGLPDAPTIIDVRIDDDVAIDPRMIPGSIRRDFRIVTSWVQAFAGQSVVVSCQKGLKLSQGVVAWLRHEGVEADSLEGASRRGGTQEPCSSLPTRCQSLTARAEPSGSPGLAPRWTASPAHGSSGVSSTRQRSSCSSRRPRSRRLLIVSLPPLRC